MSGRHNSQFWTNSCLSIDDCCCASNTCDGGRCSLQHRAPRISESMFITTSMDGHDEEKWTKQNLIVRSRKCEPELAMRSTYCTIEATDTHEASRSLFATAGLLVFVEKPMVVDSDYHWNQRREMTSLIVSAVDCNQLPTPFVEKKDVQISGWIRTFITCQIIL